MTQAPLRHRREEDEYGRFGQARLDELEDWAPWEVSLEKAWKATRSA